MSKSVSSLVLSKLAEDKSRSTSQGSTASTSAAFSTTNCLPSLDLKSFPANLEYITVFPFASSKGFCVPSSPYEPGPTVTICPQQNHPTINLRKPSRTKNKTCVGKSPYRSSYRLFLRSVCQQNTSCCLGISFRNLHTKSK